MLGEKGSTTGDRFAHYVLSLFSLLGIPAVSYGHGKKGLNDAPDFVAELGPDSVFICECKSDSPTRSEVEKLDACAERVAGQLGLRWTGKVAAALLTAVPIAQVPHDSLRAAHEKGIYIVPRERLVEFQAAISRGDSAEVAVHLLLDIRGGDSSA